MTFTPPSTQTVPPVMRRAHGAASFAMHTKEWQETSIALSRLGQAGPGEQEDAAPQHPTSIVSTGLEFRMMSDKQGPIDESRP